MNERGKSDSSVVPAKPPNKTSVAEVVEERGLAKGNTASKARPGHRAGSDASPALDRVRHVARQDKEARFTALLHHVDVDRLRAAYWALNPSAATGAETRPIEFGRFAAETTARRSRLPVPGDPTHTPRAPASQPAQSSLNWERMSRLAQRFAPTSPDHPGVTRRWRRSFAWRQLDVPCPMGQPRCHLRCLLPGRARNDVSPGAESRAGLLG